ncbi:MFS transporter [Edwardsiella tarda]
MEPLANGLPKYKLGGERAWLIWCVCTIFVLYVFGAQTIFAIVQGDIQSSLKLDITEIALVGSVYTWAFAICQFFSGPILDEFGSRKALIPAVALSVIGVWLYATAQNFMMLLLAQVVMALGAVFGFVGAGYIGGVWFGVASFGMMFGFVETSSSVASAFEQQLTALALNYISWRELMTGVGIFGIALWVAVILFVRNPTPITSPRSNITSKVFRDLFVFLKSPQHWICGIWGGITFGINLAVGVIWAPHIMMSKGLDVALSNWSASLVWLGLGVGSLFWPKWSDLASSRKKPALIGIAIQLISLALIIYIPSHLPAWLYLILWFMNGVGSANEMNSFQIAADFVPANLEGASAAFVNGMMFIIGGILMNVPAQLLSYFGGHNNLVYLPYVVILFIAFILAVIQKESYPKSK